MCYSSIPTSLDTYDSGQHRQDDKHWQLRTTRYAAGLELIQVHVKQCCMQLQINKPITYLRLVLQLVVQIAAVECDALPKACEFCMSSPTSYRNSKPPSVGCLATDKLVILTPSLPNPQSSCVYLGRDDAAALGAAPNKMDSPWCQHQEVTVLFSYSAYIHQTGHHSYRVRWILLCAITAGFKPVPILCTHLPDELCSRISDRTETVGLKHSSATFPRPCLSTTVSAPQILQHLLSMYSSAAINSAPLVGTISESTCYSVESLS